jgi:hypothetical protein
LTVESKNVRQLAASDARWQNGDIRSHGFPSEQHLQRINLIFTTEMIAAP